MFAGLTFDLVLAVAIVRVRKRGGMQSGESRGRIFELTAMGLESVRITKEDILRVSDMVWDNLKWSGSSN